MIPRNIHETAVEIDSGGARLHGTLAIPGEARALILFAHGSGSSRLSPRNVAVARGLHESGLATLLFDLLTESEDRFYENRFDIALLAERMIGATEWARVHPSTASLQLGFFGASTGAAAALRAAAGLGDEVFAVVSRGGRPDLTGPAITAVRSPTLLIVGGLDFEVLELNREAYAQLRCEKELAVVPGATHLFEEPGTLEEVTRLARRVVRAAPAARGPVGMSLQLFALEPTHELGKKVSSRLGIPLSPHEEREFEDGEHKCRPLVSVRGDDVFVIESLYSDSHRSVNDKLARLLFFLGALRDASAGRITAVVPYLAYARKDRKTKPRDPVTTRYVALSSRPSASIASWSWTCTTPPPTRTPSAAGASTSRQDPCSSVISHPCPSRAKKRSSVLSPDAGGMKRAEIFRQHLERVLGRGVRSGLMEKQRSGGVVSGEALVGEVSGSTVIVIDDLISTGTTLLRAARACRRLGARRVVAAATHGLFVGDANRLLAEPELDQILVTDTIPPFRLDPELARRKVRVLDTAELFSEAISRIHGGGSLVELLET